MKAALVTFLLASTSMSSRITYAQARADKGQLIGRRLSVGENQQKQYHLIRMIIPNDGLPDALFVDEDEKQYYGLRSKTRILKYVCMHCD